jgi:LPS sulfotransferase NodH
MRRDDYLSTLVSLEFAQRSRQWVNWSHDVQERSSAVSPFSVPVSDAVAFFDRMYRADAYFALTFSGPMYLPVHYAQLVADLPGTMSSVFGALGVPDHPVSMVTEKQVSGDDWALVENLPELQAAFEAWQVRQEV